MEEEEKAKYMEALHSFIEHRDKLKELGIVSGGRTHYLWNTGKFEKLLEVTGAKATVKREGNSSCPFRKIITVEGIEFNCIYSPTEFGCVKTGTKKVTKTEQVEVQEAVFEDEEREVEVPVWKCKDGSVFEGQV